MECMSTTRLLELSITVGKKGRRCQARFQPQPLRSSEGVKASACMSWIAWSVDRWKHPLCCERWKDGYGLRFEKPFNGKSPNEVSDYFQRVGEAFSISLYTSSITNTETHHITIATSRSPDGPAIGCLIIVMAVSRNTCHVVTARDWHNKESAKAQNQFHAYYSASPNKS